MQKSKHPEADRIEAVARRHWMRVPPEIEPIVRAALAQLTPDPDESVPTEDLTRG